MNKITIENEAGETATLTIKEYYTHLVKECNIEDFEAEENQVVPAIKVAKHIVSAIIEGRDIDAAIKSAYVDACVTAEEDIASSKDDSEIKAAEAKEAKKAKEKEKDDKDAADDAKRKLAIATRDEFVASVASGASEATSSFAEELKELALDLPDGVSLSQDGSGFGLKFADGSSKEVVGKALGYLIQKEMNSSFIGNQISFWIGDTISNAVERGIYGTAKEASEHISSVLSESLGRNIEASSLPQYQRMAERTPIALRNPKADPTAYLAISSMAMPKKASNETDDGFKARTEEFIKDRTEIQAKLGNGEVSKRKDVLPLVDSALIKHGLRQAPSTEVTVSLTENLKSFFHASFGLDDLLNVHSEGIAQYGHGGQVYSLTKDQLETIRDEAFDNLVLTYYSDKARGIKPEDYIRGFTNKTTKVESKDDDGKVTSKDAVTKAKVYPKAFFTPEVA
jgi:hypothetical protein